MKLITTTINDTSELELRRKLSNEIEQYRKHLITQYRLFIGAIFAIVALFIGATVYFTGKTHEESMRKLTENVNDKISEELVRRNMDSLLYQQIQGAVLSNIDNYINSK